jgi:site-specific DNA recombinase
VSSGVVDQGVRRKVIGYTRVSPSVQATDGVSLDVQAQKIHAYALVKDWTVAGVIRDAGVSAKHLKRPGLARPVALVRAGEVGAVIVHKLDRPPCSVKDPNSLVELFETKGVALVSLQESLDATTATGRLMMNVLASVSQWEREVIGERTREAMQHLKANGQVYSRPVVDDAATLARIQALRGAGATHQAIADTLTREGLPTARGGAWAAATVLGLVRRHPPPPQREVA